MVVWGRYYTCSVGYFATSLKPASICSVSDAAVRFAVFQVERTVVLSEQRVNRTE